MPCSGEHNCCRIKGEDCPHLVRNVEGRNFACGLFLKHRDWDQVLADPDYPTGAWGPGVNCRDWPDAGPKSGCNACGIPRAD